MKKISDEEKEVICRHFIKCFMPQKDKTPYDDSAEFAYICCNNCGTEQIYKNFCNNCGLDLSE